MRKYYYHLAMVLLLACSSDDDSTRDSAIQRACMTCKRSPAEMLWLSDIIIQAEETDSGKACSVFAIATSKGMVIVHQPYAMSCLACIRYDCDGNIIQDTSEAFIREVMDGMTSKKIIYETSR